MKRNTLIYTFSHNQRNPKSHRQYWTNSRHHHNYQPRLRVLTQARRRPFHLEIHRRFPRETNRQLYHRDLINLRCLDAVHPHATLY